MERVVPSTSFQLCSCSFPAMAGRATRISAVLSRDTGPSALHLASWLGFRGREKDRHAPAATSSRVIPRTPAFVPSRTVPPSTLTGKWHKEMPPKPSVPSPVFLKLEVEEYPAKE